MVARGVFRWHLNNQLAIRSFEEALAGAVTAEERWKAICVACRRFGFTRAEWLLNGDHFEETLVETNGEATWHMEVPLAGVGHVRLTRCFGEAASAYGAGAFRGGFAETTLL